MKAEPRLFILSVVFVLLFSSCATLSLSDRYDIYFHSNVEDAKLQVSDRVVELPFYVNVKRSKEDLKVTLLADTLQKTLS